MTIHGVPIVGLLDVVLALAAGLCIALIIWDLRVARIKHHRWMTVKGEALLREAEDFWWRYFRVFEAATAELLYVNRTIDSYVNGTAEIERPRELHSVNVSHLKEVI